MAMTKKEAIEAFAKSRKPEATLTDWERGALVGAGHQRVQVTKSIFNDYDLAVGFVNFPFFSKVV